ncbi:XK-related protein 8-like [Nematolebias whitei]|uniref:XK-related protein 8-like n=1 Tax=Nematolebias whitei TaxID=451745 RepID=UPI00189BD638|nr:XK-related protein 8-like [Nematolebias whitei]
MARFKSSSVDFLLSSLGLPLFLLDIVLDVLAAVNFYQEGSYVCLGVLLLLLMGSSVLAQLYSWLWYKYDEFKMHTEVEEHLKPSMTSLHVFQLGVYVRHAGVFETSLRSCFVLSSRAGDYAKFLSHDLAMLRLIETFSESAPQIVLMLTAILQEGRLDLLTVLKTVGSMSAVAFCVTTYHRCLRSFLTDKKTQNLFSSFIFFLWNLLLLFPRLVALSLFASVLPYFIFAHVFCSWLVLFFFAWRSKTEMMDCTFGRWLFRATVGLIWYFSWFNVAEGRTRKKTLLYHGYILADISILCGLWYWRMTTDPPVLFNVTPLHAAVTATSVVGVYILGLFLKTIYYNFFHPNVQKDELKGGASETLQSNGGSLQPADEVDFTSVMTQTDSEEGSPGMMRTSEVNAHGVTSRCLPNQSEHYNKRMRRLAENFYT